MISCAKVFSVASIALCMGMASVASHAVAQDESVEITILADKLRSQGYVCTNPSSAEHLPLESVPEEPVYLVTCENATYKLRLFPDQAAKVTEIE